MITFLPSRIFTVSAKALDEKRLVSQVGEAKAILTAVLAGEQVGQPAYDMWRSHPGHLAIYGKIVADEHHVRFGTPRSEQRFFAHHIPAWFHCISASNPQEDEHRWREDLDPWWLGDRRLHLSHIRALFNKDRKYYSKWKRIGEYPFQPCCIGCNYWWPTHVRQG